MHRLGGLCCPWVSPSLSGPSRADASTSPSPAEVPVQLQTCAPQCPLDCSPGASGRHSVPSTHAGQTPLESPRRWPLPQGRESPLPAQPLRPGYSSRPAWVHSAISILRAVDKGCPGSIQPRTDNRGMWGWISVSGQPSYVSKSTSVSTCSTALPGKIGT